MIMSEHSHRFNDVPQWFMSLQAAGAAARGGCMENATTQLDSIIRSIQKEKEIKKQRGGNQHKNQARTVGWMMPGCSQGGRLGPVK